MTVIRIVPNLSSGAFVASRDFYAAMFDFVVSVELDDWYLQLMAESDTMLQGARRSGRAPQLRHRVGDARLRLFADARPFRATHDEGLRILPISDVAGRRCFRRSPRCPVPRIPKRSSVQREGRHRTVDTTTRARVLTPNDRGGAVAPRPGAACVAARYRDSREPYAGRGAMSMPNVSWKARKYSSSSAMSPSAIHCSSVMCCRLPMISGPPHDTG